MEGKLSKKLKKLIESCEELKNSPLAVAEPKIGNALRDKLSIECITSPLVQEIMRGIRENVTALIPGFYIEIDSRARSNTAKNYVTWIGTQLSVSRYKLKFNPDRIDTMIIQGINLLDDIDKEVNNYVMRCREWYGWHFPELGKLIADNLTYVKIIKLIKLKTEASDLDLSSLVSTALEAEVKASATVSMGSDITEDDINKILTLCDQIVQISEYRANLMEYITNRMHLVAPNLCGYVGELVGARLIAHAGFISFFAIQGSLINLAKQPSSTIQILGAEKALFNALKARKNTPKYGLIYHASLVAQAPLKFKGRISRTLAAKSALAIRYDALSEQNLMTQHTIKARAKLEQKLTFMEQSVNKSSATSSRFQPKFSQYTNVSQVYSYNTANDIIIPKKRKANFDACEQLSEEASLNV
ncbi:hypothetical protein MXB_5623, partial [Myxobolus squamalis]